MAMLVLSKKSPETLTRILLAAASPRALPPPPSYSPASQITRTSFSMAHRQLQEEHHHHPPSSSTSPATLRKLLSIWPSMYDSPVVAGEHWDAWSGVVADSAFRHRSFAAGDHHRRPIGSGAMAARTPAQSRTSVDYGFSGDEVLRERYRDAWGEVRIEKLLSDMDALAGTIAIKHSSYDVDGVARPLLLVTAAIDDVILKRPIRADEDLTVTGAVAWVGRSSLEIRMEALQQQEEVEGGRNPSALSARFTFVACDAESGRPVPVRRLSPETDPEWSLFEQGENRDKMWKIKKKEEEEKGGGDCSARCRRWSSNDDDEARLENITMTISSVAACHPEQRNPYGKVFGGFLLHRAFELASSSAAYAFSGGSRRPRFLRLNRTDFLKPVHVGDLLHLESRVEEPPPENVAAAPKSEEMRPPVVFDVEVVVAKLAGRNELLLHQDRELTHAFNFTFAVSGEEEDCS